ncbi:MAG: metalloregulator ArsR/SmtB family transcription factor [Blastocatellia bacterium]|nr:metalloregulator ArsR/SmtB family transcription factor [Blastocatellia bacterium]
MPYRTVVTKELGGLLGILSHPCRLQIVEELREGERDVNSLQESLGISHSGVSQHLTTLRAHQVVLERREGRHVFYRLRQPELAAWLVEGLAFIENDRESLERISSAVQAARQVWLARKIEAVSVSPEQPEAAHPQEIIEPAKDNPSGRDQ